jgi:glycosyltransferase involved in cell wall biosynthesis
VLEAIEGGTSRHVIDVVAHATATDHTVVVPPRRVGGETDERCVPSLRAAGADVELLAMHRTPWSRANAPALWRLRRLIRAVAPDVVHGHSSIGGLLARLAATGTGIPTVYTPNGITSVRAGRLVERSLAGRTDRFVAVSHSEADLARTLRLAADVVVIPNGIDLTHPSAPVDLRAHLELPPGVPLVGAHARRVPPQAPAVLVAAWARFGAELPEARFVLIGAGELEAEVDRTVEGSPVADRFWRIPVLPGAAGVLDQLDVFALSSRFEGGPYAPLEAMRAGTPVVLTEVVGSRDTVEDGVSGLIVPPEDPASLAEAVISLLRDPERRVAMGQAGRRRLEERFDVRAMGRALDELYAGIAGR